MVNIFKDSIAKWFTIQLNVTLHYIDTLYTGLYLRHMPSYISIYYNQYNAFSNLHEFAFSFYYCEAMFTLHRGRYLLSVCYLLRSQMLKVRNIFLLTSTDGTLYYILGLGVADSRLRPFPPNKVGIGLTWPRYQRIIFYWFILIHICSVLLNFRMQILLRPISGSYNVLWLQPDKIVLYLSLYRIISWISGLISIQ